MKFYDRLVKETQTQRQALYSVSQLQDGLKGDISVDSYIAYLTQAYHHVRHTVPMLMSMGARLPDEKNWMRAVVVEYLEEEIGHEEWILNDIAAAGGNKEAVRTSVPHAATSLMLSYNYDYIARKNPVGFFGMVFMLESTSTQIATAGAEALKKSLGLPDKAFTYLYSHGTIDLEHMKFLEATLDRITDEADQSAIIEVAQNAFLLFAEIFKAIPHKNAGMRHAA